MMDSTLLHDLADFAMGGTAAMFATLFTNPVEVVKTRLQLQGELKGGQQRRLYKNVPHGLYLIFRNEGMVALQSGLTAMLGFQFCLNTFRLGIYSVCEKRGLTTNAEGKTAMLAAAAAAGVGGALGSIAGSPFYLVKTRLQSQAAKAIAVGHQHKHTGTCSAILEIYGKEGFTGLFRGVSPQIPRGMFGSSAQMVSFGIAKDWLRQYDFFAKSPLTLSFFGACLGGITMTVCLNPFDVVATRLSNQPLNSNHSGKLYNGMIDCLVKITKTEGIQGLYKGFTANYLRLGPHTVLLLVCWDQLKYIKLLITSHDK